MYETFARLMEERRLTPYKVAKATGISQSTLSDWKCGKSSPKVDKLQTLADFFGVPLSVLTGENAYGVEDGLAFGTLEYALYGEARLLDEEEKQQLLELARLLRRKKQS